MELRPCVPNNGAGVPFGLRPHPLRGRRKGLPGRKALER